MAAVEILSDTFCFNNLYRVNHVTNTNGVVLDHVMTHVSAITVQQSAFFLVSSDVHHSPIHKEVNCNVEEVDSRLDFGSFYIDFKSDNIFDIGN